MPTDAVRVRYTGFKPETVTLKAGTIRREGAMPLSCDILLERDKEIGGQSLDDIPSRMGVPLNATSGLERFEGADPAYWVSKGYAVVNPDTRGAYFSEGNINYWGRQYAEDGYDIIEWIAKQNWSNEKKSE